MQTTDEASFNEPEEVFTQLSPELYARFYHLEMAAYIADCPFYQYFLRGNEQLLELGCGTGRLSRQLTGFGHTVLGIDFSPAMLTIAKQQSPSVPYVCMDMRRTSFNRLFSSIIIPYNTLNLLRTIDDIRQTLHNCHNLLTPGGKLLLHLAKSDTEMPNSSARSMQFHLLPLSEGGVLVKELFRSWHPAQRQILLDERYKLRPKQGDKSNYRCIQPLLVFPEHDWRDLLLAAGLQTIFSSSQQPQLFPFAQQAKALLICASKSPWQ